MIDYRHKLLAHNELSPHREVEIWPAGHMVDEPIVVEARAAIDLRGIAEARRLFAFQESRFVEAANMLLLELREREGWPPPEREVRLRLDECESSD